MNRALCIVLATCSTFLLAVIIVCGTYLMEIK